MPDPMMPRPMSAMRCMKEISGQATRIGRESYHGDGAEETKRRLSAAATHRQLEGDKDMADGKQTSGQGVRVITDLVFAAPGGWATGAWPPISSASLPPVVSPWRRSNIA